jgi:hypothetical protein
MDRTFTALGVRTYAKNAYTTFTGFADKLRQKMQLDPNTVDAVIDFEKFIELRALANIYQKSLNLDREGNSPFDDDKVLERIQAERESTRRLLLQSSSQQSGLFAVHMHLVREAEKRFLSDTHFVDTIDEPEDPEDTEAAVALSDLREMVDGLRGDKGGSKGAQMAALVDVLDNAGVFKSIDEKVGD